MVAIEELRARVRDKPLPRHVAIIMDGNGRWAAQRGRPRLEGHRQGAASVRAVVREARRAGLQCLTLYAFSTENWERPAEEVAGLMDLLRESLVEERPEIMGNGIRIVAVGDVTRLPAHVREVLDALVADSAGNPDMTLALALSYGGREEIARAAAALARAGGPFTEEGLRAHLFTHGLPDPDLVVRTSGEHRLSNFLLFQSAYAELRFVPTLWPDFREAELLEAILDYQSRSRRFGKL